MDDCGAIIEAKHRGGQILRIFYGNIDQDKNNILQINATHAEANSQATQLAVNFIRAGRVSNPQSGR